MYTPLERDPPHYLKRLLRTQTPKRLMWLDCGARNNREHGVFMERWRHGALGTTHWTSKTGKRKDTLSVFHDASALWQVADMFCTSNRRVVLFTFDLAYQLRISEMLVHLPTLGWRLDKIVLERTASWALLRHGKRSLMCCDLMSWVPVGLNTLAADLAITPMPERAAHTHRDRDAIAAMINCDIVRDATLQILDWINAENLGGFRPTGSGQSYAAYRRRFMSHSLLVHDDTERLENERAAMWSGRCEAWRHGPLTVGRYVEYDMHAAYCHIAHECDVPVMALGKPSTPSTSTVERLLERYALLAEVTITTDIPLVPTSHANRTLWPIGTFRTVLWDPEIKLLLRHGVKVRFERVWRYSREPALSAFSAYVLNALEDRSLQHGMVPLRVLKHWSRCLVGRLGLRFRKWEPFGPQSPPDLRLITYCDVDAGISTDMLIAGNERLILSEMREATESLPQIPGWVMSECRARLWQAMANVGHSNVVYMDTDSLMVDVGYGPDRVDAVRDLLPGQWAIKGEYERITINGPRNLTVETTRRIAGIPLSARQVAPLEFSGQVMRSIKESMRAGELNCVASIPRTFVMDTPDMRRQHNPDGTTQPFKLGET